MLEPKPAKIRDIIEELSEKGLDRLRKDRDPKEPDEYNEEADVYQVAAAMASKVTDGPYRVVEFVAINTKVLRVAYGGGALPYTKTFLDSMEKMPEVISVPVGEWFTPEGDEFLLYLRAACMLKQQNPKEFTWVGVPALVASLEDLDRVVKASAATQRQNLAYMSTSGSDRFVMDDDEFQRIDAEWPDYINVGKGSYGVVKRVVNNGAPTDVVVKRMNLDLSKNVDEFDSIPWGNVSDLNRWAELEQEITKAIKAAKESIRNQQMELSQSRSKPGRDNLKEGLRLLEGHLNKLNQFRASTVRYDKVVINAEVTAAFAFSRYVERGDLAKGLTDLLQCLEEYNVEERIRGAMLHTFYVAALNCDVGSSCITLQEIFLRLHRDVAARNILLERSCALLADFGAVGKIGLPESHVTVVFGNSCKPVSADTFVITHDIIQTLSKSVPFDESAYMASCRDRAAAGQQISTADFFKGAAAYWTGSKLLGWMDDEDRNRYCDQDDKVRFKLLYEDFIDALDDARREMAS
eukprot:TRINITY_DN8416_c0_g1_i1.p1 TRINITY_DN8416_c0_g1~~TRINITY_DN8416_c0_g1_i1.p1  ORF type:complete len:522 (+),score=92.60 TRINITY_DN8416_c0_g1_i1:3-1568(+)